MSIPDPKALLGEVSGELKEAQEKAGLGNADAVVAKLEEIKNKAKEGPGDLVDKIKGEFKNFMDKMQETIDDPGSLMGGGGALAACASYFAKQVLEKLKALKEEGEKIFSTIAKMASGLASSFPDLGAALGKVMEVLGQQMKKMMALPKELEDLAGTVSGPEDLGKLDVDDLKKAIDTSALSSVFEELGGVKGNMGPTLQQAADTMEQIGDFITDLPAKLASAFDTPLAKCTCMQGPQALQDLMSKVGVLKDLDMGPLVETLKQTKESVSNMDVEAVKKPIEEFASAAGDPIGKLEKGVSAAKAAGGLGDAARAIGGMFG